MRYTKILTINFAVDLFCRQNNLEKAQHEKFKTPSLLNSLGTFLLRIISLVKS